MNRIKELNERDYGDFEEELGNAVFEAYMEDDNFMCDVGESVISTFNACKTEREMEIADRMLAAICGWGINTLIRRIEGD